MSGTWKPVSMLGVKTGFHAWYENRFPCLVWKPVSMLGMKIDFHALYENQFPHLVWKPVSVLGMKTGFRAWHENRFLCRFSCQAWKPVFKLGMKTSFHAWHENRFPRWLKQRWKPASRLAKVRPKVAKIISREDMTLAPLQVHQVRGPLWRRRGDVPAG